MMIHPNFLILAGPTTHQSSPRSQNRLSAIQLFNCSVSWEKYIYRPIPSIVMNRNTHLHLHLHLHISYIHVLYLSLSIPQFHHHITSHPITSSINTRIRYLPSLPSIDAHTSISKRSQRTRLLYSGFDGSLHLYILSSPLLSSPTHIPTRVLP